MVNASQIRSAALAAGFDRVGIARVRELPDGERLQRWLEEGRHGSMEYMAGEGRGDVRARFPWAASVISLACAYASKGDEVPAAGCGRVSRYARGGDYHAAMEKKLKVLREEIRRQAPAAQAWWVVDTAPVMEKPWAREAGLGWLGKNTLSIDREAGSYFFLGTIVTDLELEADAPAMDMCGSCTLCLDACPTGALTAAGQMDARLCISYLTIEHRGPIEEELRAKMGTWVFGCDVCQEVCPWNREGPERAEAGPRLVEWLRMTEPEYQERTKGTAMRRAKRAMLRRNAAIALGNEGDASARQALEEAARDEDPMVAESARWALGRLK